MIDETNRETKAEIRAQREKTVEEFRQSLRKVHEELQDLINRKGVMSGTALYGLMRTAEYAILMADSHCNELNAVLTDLDSGDWIS